MALAPTFLPHGAKLFCVGLTNGYQPPPTVQALTMLDHGQLRGALVNMHHALGLPTRRVGAHVHLVLATERR